MLSDPSHGCGSNEILRAASLFKGETLDVELMCCNCPFPEENVDIQHMLEVVNPGLAQMESHCLGTVKPAELLVGTVKSAVIEQEALKDLNTQLRSPSSHLPNVEVDRVGLVALSLY